MFEDRDDAARQLASQLHAYRHLHPLVLAIPRGAVPMAWVFAQQLDGDFDVVLVRKLRAPFQPEVAIGAVDETGCSQLDDDAPLIGADEAYIEGEKQRQMATIQARRAKYTPFRQAVDPAGRMVIVVDDGLATGATMMSALHSLRQLQPARLVCTVPVASPEALEKVRPMADELVCLQRPADFHAVGQFYRNFAQVSDEDVVALLQSPKLRARSDRA